MPTKNVSGADNQQGTLLNFYYTGFCAGEMSCSLLRLSNHKSKKGGVYFVPDITMIKGGYNLSIRGKRKVKKAFLFFQKYKPLAGDLFFSKIKLLTKAVSILGKRKTYRRTRGQLTLLEGIRSDFKKLKLSAKPIFKIPRSKFAKDAIGHFLAGVLDAEGSVGMKKNGTKGQPFIAVAMKDRNIIELFKSFLGFGNIHDRPKENMFHFEIGSRKEVLQTINIFLKVYPSRLPKMTERMKNLQRHLNDYTLRSD